jgi:pantothenate synthetase
VKEQEQRAAQLLEELLLRIPSLTVESVKVEPSVTDRGVDILARVHSAEQDYVLICEFKQSGQPRFAREAINQMRAHLARSDREAVPVFVVPF